MTPREGAGSVRAIARNTGWLAVGKIVGAVLSLVYLAIVTRSLGVAGFGQFSLALGLAQAIELLIAFQSWQIVVRYGVPHDHGGRAGALTRLLAFTTWLDIGAAVAAAIAVAVTMPLLGGHFGWDAQFIGQATACGIVFVVATHWTPIGVLLMRDRFAAAAIADGVTPAVRFAGSILVWATHPSVVGFLAVWAAAELLTALAYWGFALRAAKISRELVKPPPWRAVAAENPGIGAYALATNFKSSLDVGGKQVAVLLVGLLLNPAAVGGFRLAQQLAQSLVTLSQLVARAVFPELMRSRAGEEPTRQFEALLARTLRVTVIGGAGVVLVLLFAGRPLLGLIAGAQYVSAYPILLLLGAAAAVEFAAVSLEPAMVALGRPGLALAVRAASTILLFGGIALLTPRFGAPGAGAGVLAASLIAAASFAVLVRRLRAAPD